MNIGTKLPFHPEAEEAILGAFINNNHSLDKVIDFLSSDHFYLAINKKIYQAIIKIVGAHHPATYLTIRSYFQRDTNIADISRYLTDIISKAQLLVDVESLARMIHDAYIKRELINISQKIASKAANSSIEDEANQQLEEAEKQIFDLANFGYTDDNCIDFNRALNTTVKRTVEIKEKRRDVSGVSSGFEAIDKITGGFQNSDLIIIAARPSMGKTALAINMAFNSAKSFLSAKENQSIAVFSLEMSTEQIVTRIISTNTGIESNKIRNGTYLTSEDISLITKTSIDISDLPIFIDDSASPTISAIRTRSRRMKRQHNLGMIVIDYLQLIRGVENHANKVNEIGEVSQGLKAIAKELNIPVIALSQLSRAVESREDKRPMLSDLRDSGNIEQDADLVMFLYREEYYMMRKKQPEDIEKHKVLQERLQAVKNTAEVIIAKHRNGPVDTVTLFFDAKTTKFSNIYTNE